MRRPPPAWFDQQYNNRARIPASAAILQRWHDDSVLARARHPGMVELAYGSDPSERLDLFVPNARGAPGVPGAPVLVYLHGGYWRALDKRDQSFIAPPFVAAGAMVVVPNYALCPAVRIDHIVLQMVQALAWVHRHAAAHGGDPSRIVVAGHSAGGHLAAMLLACAWRSVAPDLPRDLVKSALSISGLHDLEPLRHAPFLAPDLRLTARSARRLSPAALPAPRGALVTVVGGDESEEFHRQAALIAQAWGPRAVIGHEAVPGHHHLDVLDELIDPRAATHRRALQLLDLAPAGGAPPDRSRVDRAASLRADTKGVAAALRMARRADPTRRPM